MKRSKFIIGLTATALVLPLGAISAGATEVAPDTATEWTEWVSDDGGSAGRELPAISADGRYVAFVGRSDEFGGVWIKDRAKLGTPAKQVATGFLFNPDISADGTTVAWTQYGSTSSGGQQVYRLKWQDPDAYPRVVSRGDDDEVAQGVTDFPSLSGNGRYVAFQSMDMTLDEDVVSGGQGGNRTKAYVRDTLKGTTEMVSVLGTNTIPNGSGMKPDITPDGRYVAFYSDSTDLQGIVSEEDGGEVTAAAEEEETVTFQQVFRRDRVAKTTIGVSVTDADDAVYGDGGSAIVGGPTISDNGARVAFDSMAENLVDGDTNLDTDAFVRLIGAGTTVRISLDENGAQVDTDDTDDVAAGGVDDPNTNEDESKAVDALPVGAAPAINGKAGLVAFQSTAVLMAEDENGVSDVYRFGLEGSSDPGLTRWSVVDDPADPLAFEATGTREDGSTGETVPASNGADPTITRDGTRIAFVSQGNLTGRIVEAEEGEDPTTATSIEPSIYLHRPNPEPETIAPRSKAFSPDVDRTSPIKVTYTKTDVGFPRSGVVAVRLYVKKPGWTAFKLVQTDRKPNMDNVFFVSSVRDGKYRFYTRAVDLAGNVEARPATADSVTLNP